MRHSLTSGDSVHLPEDTYLVVRQKGQSRPYTQLIHVDDEKRAAVTALGGRPQALFYQLALRLGFDHIARMTVEEMVKETQTSRSRLYDALAKLKEVDLVKKVAKDTYKLNPEYVWRGRSGDRHKAIEEWPLIGVKKESKSE